MQTYFLTFLEISISASIVIAILLLFSQLFNKRYAMKWKYWIWLCLSLRLLLPINLSLPVPQPLSLSIPTTAMTDTFVPLPLSPQARPAYQPSLLSALTLLWLCGCILVLAVHLFGYLHYKQKILQHCESVQDSAILQQAELLSQEMNLKRKIPVIISAECSCPMILGFLHTRLILPKTAYLPEESFFICKHELVHLKRFDTWYKLLLMIVSAIHWFNPFVSLLKKEAIADLELSCDEAVIQNEPPSVRQAYAETLLSTLTKQSQNGTALTTQLNGGTKLMKKRFQNILTSAPKKNGFLLLVCTLVLTLAMGTLVACSSPAPQAGNTQPPTDDAEAITDVVTAFSAAYFAGDEETLRTYLTDPYPWDVEVYTASEDIADVSISDLSGISGKEVGYVETVSLQFRPSPDADSFQYLTMELAKQDEGWKVQFYGIEG